MAPAMKSQESDLAADFLGHKLEDSTSREDVHKILHRVLDDRAELREAKKQAKFRGRVIVLGIVAIVLVFAACLLAAYTGIEITKDTKHRHKSNTASGTEVLETSDGNALTTSLTIFEESGGEAMCALLHPGGQLDNRQLGSLRDCTITYQGETAEHLLHLRVGSVKHSVPDDPEDDAAIIGEIASVSGRISVVLAQDGVIYVSEDGERFATGETCNVAEHERRRLQPGADVSSSIGGHFVAGFW